MNAERLPSRREPLNAELPIVSTLALIPDASVRFRERGLISAEQLCSADTRRVDEAFVVWDFDTASAANDRRAAKSVPPASRPCDSTPLVARCEVARILREGIRL